MNLTNKLMSGSARLNMTAMGTLLSTQLLFAQVIPPAFLELAEHYRFTGTVEGNSEDLGFSSPELDYPGLEAAIGDQVTGSFTVLAHRPRRYGDRTRRLPRHSEHHGPPCKIEWNGYDSRRRSIRPLHRRQ